jgi:hypothetical protein
MDIETFGAFLRKKYGPEWVLAARLTPKLKRAGYLVAVTREQMTFDEIEWAKACAKAYPEIAVCADALRRVQDSSSALRAAQILAGKA